MKIFIGSSKESLEVVREVSVIIESIGHCPKPWNKDTFTPTMHVFECLENTLNSVDAAVFIFNEDDIQWYRETKVTTVRDNVLLEYGLFCGALGRSNVVICVKGEPKLASDLNGLIYIPLDKIHQAECSIIKWIEGCQPKNIGDFKNSKHNNLDLELVGAWKHDSGHKLFLQDTRGGSLVLLSTGMVGGGSDIPWKVEDNLFMLKSNDSDRYVIYTYRVVDSTLTLYRHRDGKEGVYRKIG